MLFKNNRNLKNECLSAHKHTIRLIIVRDCILTETFDIFKYLYSHEKFE